jgi:hypothetical protein
MVDRYEKVELRGGRVGSGRGSSSHEIEFFFSTVKANMANFPSNINYSALLT